MWRTACRALGRLVGGELQALCHLLFLTVPWYRLVKGLLCPTLCNPWTVAPARLLCPWGFSRQECWNGLLYPPPGDLPGPGIKPRSPSLQADSLRPEPPGKPKNTGVVSLSLLQGIFPTQESNWGGVRGNARQAACS